MKPEFNTEFDALLRGHARDGAARAGDGGAAAAFARTGGEGARTAASDAHLDADELSAFAENVLPPARRALYAGHLADCGDCRRIVTEIALSSDAAAAAHVPALVADGRSSVAGVGAAASWRERLAALFAPSAWRYAMPVVALLCVGLVALVLMKRVPREGNGELASRRADSQVAKTQAAPQEEQQHAQFDKQTGEAQSTAATSRDDVANRPAATAAAAAPNATTESEQKTARAGAVASAGQVAAESNTDPPREVAESRAEPPPAPKSAAPELVTVTPPASMPAPAVIQATPPPRASDETVEVAQDEQSFKKNEAAVERKRARAKPDSAEGGRGAGASVARAEARGSNRNALINSKTTLTPSSGVEERGAGRRAARRTSSDREASNNDTARANTVGETRGVGGRKFRRQGGAWIDTAYNPGQATTNVRRDSEQYRSLAADEPGIARIANALGGEVVVVWKGRAYRIRQ